MSLFTGKDDIITHKPIIVTVIYMPRNVFLGGAKPIKVV
jgi:hypothetical protein